MQDPDVQDLQNVIRGEPLPYFAQISANQRNGIILEEAVDYDDSHGDTAATGVKESRSVNPEMASKWEEVHGTTEVVYHNRGMEEDAMNLLRFVDQCHALLAV